MTVKIHFRGLDLLVVGEFDEQDNYFLDEIYHKGNDISSMFIDYEIEGQLIEKVIETIRSEKNVPYYL